MHAGDRILHPEHGAGSVIALKCGRRVRVRLDAVPKLPMTFRRGELTLLDRDEACRPAATVDNGRGNGAGRGARQTPARTSRGKPTNQRAESPPRRLTQTAVFSGGAAAAPDERVELRQTVEALRLGVVPARYVRDYTVGRAAELASFDALLQTGRGLRALWGDYGHGKTHQLEVLERVALEQRFVTARITLDPREVPSTHPKRLYRAIVSALVFPDHGGEGLDPLMHRLADSAAHRDADGASASRFFSPYLHALHHGDDTLITWMHDYVSGLDVERSRLLQRLSHAGWRGDYPFTLSDYRTYGRMYVHMLGTLACWVRDAGFRGLLLLFDEVEGVDQLGRAQRMYGVQVLMHFAAVAVPKSKLAFDPASHADLYRGGRAVHRQIPLRFRRNQPLAVVFAFTPLEDIRALFRQIVADESLDVHLQPLTARETRTLVRRVGRLYARAYPDFAPTHGQLARLAQEVEEAIADGHSSARDVVRGVVFLLDAIRLVRGSAGNGRVG